MSVAGLYRRTLITGSKSASVSPAETLILATSSLLPLMWTWVAFPPGALNQSTVCFGGLHPAAECHFCENTEPSSCLQSKQHNSWRNRGKGATSL